MSTTELPKIVAFQPVRLSVARYHELTRAGAFTEHDAVELLDGVVVEKMSKNPPHRLATRKCNLPVGMYKTKNRLRCKTASQNLTWRSCADA